MEHDRLVGDLLQFDDDAPGRLGDGRDEGARAVGDVRAVIATATDEEKAFVGLQLRRPRHEHPVLPHLPIDLLRTPPRLARHPDDGVRCLPAPLHHLPVVGLILVVEVVVDRQLHRRADRRGRGGRTAGLEPGEEGDHGDQEEGSAQRHGGIQRWGWGGRS